MIPLLGFVLHHLIEEDTWMALRTQKIVWIFCQLVGSAVCWKNVWFAPNNDYYLAGKYIFWLLANIWWHLDFVYEVFVWIILSDNVLLVKENNWCCNKFVCDGMW